MLKIVNQDRNNKRPYIYDGTNKFTTAPAMSKAEVNGMEKKRIFGINLYMDDNFLGTFDTVQESIDEISKITRCQTSYYCVTGYSTWDIVEHMMLEGN